MHDLSKYIQYADKILTGEHSVLAWSKKSGYFFTQYGFCLGDVKVIAIKEK